MNIDQAERLIRTVLHQVAPDADLDNLARDDDLQDTLELDSLDFLRVVELLSAQTGIRIDEEDYPRLSTLDSAVRWLGAVTSTAGAATE